MSVRLFVGNLPYSATEVDIRQHFGTVGDPLQIVIPTDRETGRPRGFAFVDYDDRGVAERAVQQLHGQPFKGRPLSVSEARPREARPPMGVGAPPRPMGAPPPRPGGFSSPRPSEGAGDYRQNRGGDSGNRNFGPNKPPKGRGGSSFSKKRQQEGQAKGPLKERLSGRMFTVEEDARFKDEEDPMGEINVEALKEEVAADADDTDE
jgi:cold-inducible RNA-binding protein